MAQNDPSGLRREGARLLVDRCPAGTRFTLLSFNQEPRVLVNGTADAGALENAIGKVGAEGGTLMCAALGALRGTVGSAEGPKAAVLFTDGLSHDRCTARDLSREGWRLSLPSVCREPLTGQRCRPWRRRLAACTSTR